MWGLAMTMLRGQCPKTMVFLVQFPDQQHQVTWKFVKNAIFSGGQSVLISLQAILMQAQVGETPPLGEVETEGTPRSRAREHP